MLSPTNWDQAVKDGLYKMGQSTKQMNLLEKHLGVMKDCLDSGHELGEYALKDMVKLLDTMNDKYKAATKYYEDLMDMGPDPGIAAWIEANIGMMDDHRHTIRSATMEVTSKPLPAAPDPTPVSPASSNRSGPTLKVQSALKPARLSAEATMNKFGACSASNMDTLPINQKRGFLESCLEPEMVCSLRREVSDS